MAAEKISAREEDHNGMVLITGNPISRTGVFEYSGAQIDQKGFFGLQKDRIYKVYRSEEELNNPETIESFKLLPWTEDHSMFGEKYRGYSENGIYGTIGEDVYFEDGFLKANIKIYSRILADAVEYGKKELSAGFTCMYDAVSGNFEGEAYDFIQTRIRGNHLALVTEGRAGSEVSVLDSKLNNTEVKKMADSDKEVKSEDESEIEAKDEAEGEGVTLESLKMAIDGLVSTVAGLVAAEQKEAEAAVGDEDAGEESGTRGVTVTKAADGDGFSVAMDSRLKDLEASFKSFQKDGMRKLSREISERNALAEMLSKEVGVFDHSDMSVGEVAAYGVKELGLKCEKGLERAVLDGFFAGSKQTAVAQDSAIFHGTRGMSSVKKESDKTFIMNKYFKRGE